MEKENFIASLTDEQIKEFIESTFTESGKVELFNNVVEAVNCEVDKIYSLDDTEDIDSHFSTPSNLLRAIKYGSFNAQHDYWRIDGYGNIATFASNEIDEYVFIYLADIADYVRERHDKDELLEYFGFNGEEEEE